MAFPDPLRAFLPGGRARHLASHTLAKVITIEARSWPQEDVEKVHELTDLDDLTRFDGILDPFCTVPTVTRFWGEHMHMEGLSSHLKGKTLHMGHFDCKKSALKLRSLRKLLSCSPQLEYFCFE